MISLMLNINIISIFIIIVLISNSIIRVLLFKSNTLLYYYTEKAKMHRIEISISHSRWFDNQRQMAEFLCIKNSSKKAIESRCRVFGYEVEFDS